MPATAPDDAERMFDAVAHVHEHRSVPCDIKPTEIRP